MAKHENLDNPEGNSGETPEQKEMSDELKKMAKDAGEIDLSGFDENWQKAEAKRQQELYDEEGLSVEDLAQAIRGVNNFQELYKVLGEQKQKQLLDDKGIKWKISDVVFYIENIDDMTEKNPPTKSEVEYIVSNFGIKDLGNKVREFLEKRIKESEKSEKNIEDAESFDDLYEILEKKVSIEGSSKKYTAEELIGIIEDFRSKGGIGKSYFNITKTDGLRDRVGYLILKERKNK